MESYVKHNRRFLWNPSYVITADIFSLLRSRLFLSPLAWVVWLYGGLCLLTHGGSKMAAGQRDAHVAQGYLPVTSHKAEGYARPTFSSSLYFFSSTFLAITAQ